MNKCPKCGGVLRYIPIQVMLGDGYDYKKQLQCVDCDYVGEVIDLSIEDYRVWGTGEE